jgi:hypothetical protein
MRRLLLKTFLTQWVGVMFWMYVCFWLQEAWPVHLTLILPLVLALVSSAVCGSLVTASKKEVEGLRPEELSTGLPLAGGLTAACLVLVAVTAVYWAPLLRDVKEEDWDESARLFILTWLVPSMCLIPALTSCLRLGIYGLSVKARTQE